MRLSLTLLSLIFLTGCLNLDGMVHNPVHCSNITTVTCEDQVYWDKIFPDCATP